MRRLIPSVLLSVLLLLAAALQPSRASSLASDDSVQYSINISAWTGYGYTDIPGPVTTMPVEQTNIMATWGHMNLFAWNSVGLGGGRYGYSDVHQRRADEWDFGASYTDMFKTHLGDVVYEIGTKYIALPYSKGGIWSSTDDALNAYVEVGLREAVAEGITATPYVKFSGYYHLDGRTPFDPVIGYGVKFVADLGNGFSLNANIGGASNPVRHETFGRFTANIAKSFGRWSVDVGAQEVTFAEHPVYGVTFSGRF